MKILVVGSGGVGAAFAPIAARRDFYEHIVFADYDEARARSVVDRYDAAAFVWHRPHRYRAQLRRQRADAEPGKQHRPGHDLGAGADVEHRDQHDQAGERATRTRSGPPAAATRSGSSFGTPTAASSSVIDSGRSRTPVAMADRPERDRQEQRDDEEQTGLQQVLEEERHEARRAGDVCAAWRGR